MVWVIQKILSLSVRSRSVLYVWRPVVALSPMVSIVLYSIEDTKSLFISE